MRRHIHSHPKDRRNAGARLTFPEKKSNSPPTPIATGVSQRLEVLRDPHVLSGYAHADKEDRSAASVDLVNGVLLVFGLADITVVRASDDAVIPHGVQGI